MGGRAQLLKLLGGEDVDGDQVDLGVAVLASLGGGHLDDLAGTVLDDDETVLPQRGTLHGESLRGTGIGALEGVLMLQAMLLAWVGDGEVQQRCAHGGSGKGEGGVRCTRGQRAQRRGGTYLRVVGHGG